MVCFNSHSWDKLEDVACLTESENDVKAPGDTPVRILSVSQKCTHSTKSYRYILVIRRGRSDINDRGVSPKMHLDKNKTGSYGKSPARGKGNKVTHETQRE